MDSGQADRTFGPQSDAVAALLASIDRLNGPVPWPWTRADEALSLRWSELARGHAKTDFENAYARVRLALVDRVQGLAPELVIEEPHGHGEYTLTVVSGPGWVDYNTILWILVMDLMLPGLARPDLVADARNVWERATGPRPSAGRAPAARPERAGRF